MNSRSAASIAPRLVATVALGAAVALGATGCTFMTHQATTNVYSASDGVNIDSTGGDVVVRNAFVVATEDGAVGNFVAAFINEGSDSATVEIDVNGVQQTLQVPANERVSLGVDGDEPLLINGLNAKPGATVNVLITSGDGEAEPTAVPVLDGTLPSYSDLVPAEVQPADDATAE